jgi:hypothetical protein
MYNTEYKQRFIEEKIKEKAPLFVEEIAVDFEELFIGEVQARGYLE